MSNSKDKRGVEAEQLDSVGRLIARAGRRSEPDAGLESQAYATVLSEWERLVRARRRRNVVVTSLAAAAAFAAIGAVTLLNLPRADDAAVVARVVRATGDVTFKAADGTTTFVAGLAEPRALRVGQTVVTGSRGGIHLATGNGLSLRIAPASRVNWRNAQLVELVAGAIYVDSPVSAPDAGPALSILTRYAQVTHIGTQYLVEIDTAGLTVRVREGVVAIQRENSRQLARSAEQVTVREDGSVQRGRTPVTGRAWSWAQSLAGDFDITGRPLLEFLQWVARETGKSLEIADASVREEATAAILHGSTADMTIESALDLVMSTTALSVAVTDEKLVVTRR